MKLEPGHNIEKEGFTHTEFSFYCISRSHFVEDTSSYPHNIGSLNFLLISDG